MVFDALWQDEELQASIARETTEAELNDLRRGMLEGVGPKRHGLCQSLLLVGPGLSLADGARQLFDDLVREEGRTYMIQEDLLRVNEWIQPTPTM